MLTESMITAAITGLFGTFIGGALAAFLTGLFEVRLERQKFEATLITKALESKDEQERANYLMFLVSSGLVPGLNGANIKALAEKPEVLPRSIHDIVLSKGTVAGPIKVTEPEWESWDKEGVDILIAQREYNSGRILAVGHDSVLTNLNIPGNKEVLEKAFRFLKGSVDTPLILFSDGHCEWVPTKYKTEAENLFKTLREYKYRVERISKVIDSAKLKGACVLVIGNAWGNLSDSEIDSIEKFVSNGGGLFVAGVTWSWKQYSCKDGYRCEGKMQGQDVEDISTYPMNRVVKQFGMTFQDSQIKAW